jgi:hypothetical protein
VLDKWRLNCRWRGKEVLVYVAVPLEDKASVFITEWWGSLREGDHWEDPDVDVRIILGGIFRKWEGIVGTGWSGLRRGTGGGHL